MRSYATANNSIVLNATGNKRVSNESNTVNIYGNKVLINGNSIAFDGITYLSSITVGSQKLDAMIYADLSARISEMIDSKIASEINNI